jgi:predicted DNA-binding transcriptional regulator YafY
MRKASRLFEIIQILRLARRPLTAAHLAQALECGERTVYRDIAALQGMRVPIEGERGIGYILRPGFDLPPLMFTAEETEAIVVGLALLQRTGDLSLHKSARAAGDKIAASLPPPLARLAGAGALHAWGAVGSAPTGLDLGMVRQAIREERKLDLSYVNEQGAQTQRVIRPIALVYYSAHATLVGWCDLRSALRNFRADRVGRATLMPDRFQGQGDRLRALWVQGWESPS